MSRNQGPQGRRGGGLLPRAQEGPEAIVFPEVPRVTVSRNRDFDGPRPAPSPPRPKQQLPASPAPSRVGGGVGIAISRPAQVPQWPLITPLQASSSPSDEFSSERRPVPQRPPRPSNVPSILDGSRVQDPTPAFQYRPQQNKTQETTLFRESDTSTAEDDVYSPNVISPQTSTSRPSTVSSVGSIPDFPLPTSTPVTPSPARRSINPRPPPSSRRGASSYYSNVFFASPIPEESPRTVQSHESYASSAAMPRDWEDNVSDTYYDDDDADDDDADDPTREDAAPEEGRESGASNTDDGDERGLVRHASLGRRGRPLVVETKGSDRKTSPEGSQSSGAATAAEIPVGTAISLPGPVMTRRDIIGNADSPLASGTGLIDRSPSSGSVPTLGKNSASTEEQPAVPPLNLVALDLLLNAGNGASPGDPSRLGRVGSRLSVRRPPRLDIDAVREAESRGSLTSLPDLIRRATRLAAMMDRGKRPGSRLALSDFSPGNSELALEKESGGRDRRQSGLSGMLAAFPSPGLTTPTPDISRDITPRPPSWPMVQGSSRIGQTQEKPSRGRRRCQCCGMPAWVFMLLILSTLLIIAAAVVIPLELLVFKKNSAAAATSSQTQCEQSTSTCANGGSNVLTNGTCSCICANGFTGTGCTTPEDVGCTTINIYETSSGTALHNATLGRSIPRLLTQAQTNISIPLSADVILGRFSTDNLSCDTENALVTFDGLSTTEDAEDAVEVSVPTTTSSASPTSSASYPTSVSTFVVTPEVLDFGRVVVLYILQEVDLVTAVDVQMGIQSFFTENSGTVQTNIAATNRSVGRGVTLNFIRFSLDMGLGQGVVGGHGIATNSTSAASSTASPTSTTSTTSSTMSS